MAFFKRLFASRQKEEALSEAKIDIAMITDLGKQRDYQRGVVYSARFFEDQARVYLRKRRARSQTVREFVISLTRSSNLDREVARELITTFEFARYSGNTVDYESYNIAVQSAEILVENIKNFVAREKEDDRK